MGHGLPLCFSSVLWLLVAETSYKGHVEAKSLGRGEAWLSTLSWPHGGPRTLLQCRTSARGSVDANPGQCQKHLPRGSGLGTDPRPSHKMWRTQTWPVGCGSIQGDFWEMVSLALTFSFHHRIESEVPPRPASPKISRSPPEAAAPAEDAARRSELAQGEGHRGWAGTGCTVQTFLCF